MEVINKFKKFFGPYRIGIYTWKGSFQARFIDSQNNVEEFDYSSIGTIKIVCYILNEINTLRKQEQLNYASTEDDNDMWRYMRRAKQEARDEKVDTRLATLEKNGVPYTLGNNIVKVKHPTTGESYQYSLKRNLLYYDKDWRKVTISFLVKWYKGTIKMVLPKCYKCKEYCSIVGEDKDYKRCTSCETWC
jgi:hypothetical protein